MRQMGLRTSELVFEERRQGGGCVTGVFDWFGELRGSLGGVKANAVGGNLMRSPKHEGRFSVNLRHSVSI